MSATLHHGNCLDVLRGMADASVDSIEIARARIDHSRRLMEFA